MEQALRVRVAEPLAVYVPELIGHLVEEGYSERSVTDHVRCLAHLSRWLERQGLDPSAVDERLIEQMVDALHGAAKARKLTHWSFRVVLGFLRDRWIAPPPAVEPPTPIDELLAEYRRYLVSERALSASTVPGYVRTASSSWPRRVATIPIGWASSPPPRSVPSSWPPARGCVPRR